MRKPLLPAELTGPPAVIDSLKSMSTPNEARVDDAIRARISIDERIQRPTDAATVVDVSTMLGRASTQTKREVVKWAQDVYRAAKQPNVCEAVTLLLENPALPLGERRSALIKLTSFERGRNRPATEAWLSVKANIEALLDSTTSAYRKADVATRIAEPIDFKELNKGERRW